MKKLSDSILFNKNYLLKKVIENNKKMLSVVLISILYFLELHLQILSDTFQFNKHTFTEIDMIF